MKICVTGGAGMIGSHLVKRLVELDHDVIIIDNLWRGKLENLKNDKGYFIDVKNDFYNLDISEPKNQSKIEEIVSNCDVIIHLADIVAGIGYVFNKQYEIFRQNNLINTNLFRAASKAELTKLIYVGTACSFPLELQGSLESQLHDYDLFPANPESAYGWSKLIGQLELRYLAETVDFEINTLILHNVYGPNCEYEGDRTQVIPSLINRIQNLESGSEVEVWGSGEQGRAFVHVNDVVDAIILTIEKKGIPEYMQIGPDECTSIKDLVKELIEISGKELSIFYDTSKPEGDKGRYADFSVAKKYFDWKPRVDLRKGLSETYKWIEEHRNQ